MGTTPTYSWPYPDDTDPVADGAQNIEDLALAVETTLSGLTGRIVQIVRATDTSARSTTSTSFVDASISVTITPTSASHDVLLIWAHTAQVSSTSNSIAYLQITDSSNTAISGAEESYFGNDGTDTGYAIQALIAFDSPATTSATTYKGRFKVIGGGTTTASIRNDNTTGQLYALEIQ